MRIEHGSIALILIQLFVFSAMGGALSPTVSTTNDDANTTTPNPDFPQIPTREDVDFDWLDRADNLEPEFVPGEVLVKFRTSISVESTNGIVTTGIASVDDLNRRFEAKEIDRVFSSVYKLTLPRDADVLSVAREYEADPNVEYAEPNIIYHYSVVPNDENYTQQWTHQVIESEYAWNTTTGDPEVVIAMIDSGVDWNHPDLAANIWINTDEIPSNGEDDDNNGYVDDIRGWDFHSNDSDPMDTSGHGTHCTGIAAAVGNNEIGVAGVSWNSKIMALGCGSDGVSLSEGVLALEYAADNGADIVSMSWGSYLESFVSHDAIKYAFDRGLLLVASAGNDVWCLKSYPAAFEEVVAVSATNSGDEPASFTNFGDWIEVAAPGVNIYSTVCDDSYDSYSGTSMACPCVSGVAALIWSQFSDMTRDQVRYQLRRTADDLGDSGFDQYFGYGRINAKNAVEQALPAHDLLVLYWNTPLIWKPNEEALINTTVHNFGKRNEKKIDIKLLVNDTVVDSRRIDRLNGGASTIVSCSWTPTSEAMYNVTSYVEPVSGEVTEANNVVSEWVLVRVEKVIRVPQDYLTIQRAINTALPGYTVQVAPSLYYENLAIGKPLTLMGENKTTTIIDGGGRNVISVAGRTSNVTISGFTTRMGGECIWLMAYASGNTISGNIITLSSNSGVVVDLHSSGNTIINNTVTKIWEFGIIIAGTGNHILNNTVIDNTYGICLAASHDSTVERNNIKENSYGMSLYGVSIDNFIHHNNFCNNTSQVHVGGEYPNTWDDGYTSGGNYWSDYNANDTYSGPYQNETGSDGIGDTPYTIDSNNRDNYPFMHPLGPREVAVTNVTASDSHYNETEVHRGWNVSINVTLENEGTFVETFNVTARAYNMNTTGWETIGTQSVTVFPGANKTLTFTWDTNKTSDPWGHYSIEANASTVPGETDIDDNTMIFEKIRVKITGDVNGDGTVSVADMALVDIALGSKPGDPNWNPQADVDHDGSITVADMVLVDQHLGESES